MTKEKSSMFIGVVMCIAVLAAGYWLLNRPDQRTDGEKLGDALSAVGEGLDNAGKELGDRTLGDKIGDSLKDAKEDIQKNVDAK